MPQYIPFCIKKLFARSDPKGSMRYSTKPLESKGPLDSKPKLYKKGFFPAFKNFKIWFKAIKWEEYISICWLLSVPFSIFYFFLLEYLLDYFEIWDYFPFSSLFWVKNLLTLIFSAFSLYLIKENIPHNYVFFRSLVGYIFYLIALFFDGLTTNIFSLQGDKFKIIVKNFGGSPNLKHRWSKVSLSRYLAVIFLLVAGYLFDDWSNNGLNKEWYISLDFSYKIKCTSGFIILIFFLIHLIIRFSVLGVKLHRICKMFYSLNIFKFFISGEKVPSVLQENLFTHICSGNWFNVKELKYLCVNDKKESLLLPGHLFFFGLGRLLQVLLRILFKVLGLVIFLLLIIAFFNLILNYVSSDQFGDDTYSFYEAIRENLNSRSIISLISNDNLFSNIIEKNEPSDCNNNNLNIDQRNPIPFYSMLGFNLFLCYFGWKVANTFLPSIFS